MTSVALTVLYVAEPLLLVLAMIALLKSREQRRFPALFAYIALRLGSSAILHFLLQIRRSVPVSVQTAYAWYFYTYWLSYVAGAVIVLLVIQEMFQTALDAFPGLKWLGTISFRWVASISMIATSAVMFSPGGKGSSLLVTIVLRVMRCESVFILSLLLFLLLAAGKLGLSYRSRVFGISFGFGIMAASDLVISASSMRLGHNIMSSNISVITTAASLATLLVWSVYFLRPEPARRVAVLNPASPLARWNEVAIALGQSAPKVPQPLPASNFFLQDVEKVVDRILIKNSLNVAS